MMDNLHLADRDGAEVAVRDCGGIVAFGAYPLDHKGATNLRNYLTEWLDRFAPAEAEPARRTCSAGPRTCDCPADAQGCPALEPDLPDAEADGYSWGRPTCCTGEDSSTCCPVESTVAADAHAAVYGDRQGDYGHPREDFTRTAIIWTGLLQHKLAEGAYIEAADIARCMVGVKLARDVHSPKRDNRVDGAGYFITLDRLETGR